MGSVDNQYQKLNAKLFEQLAKLAGTKYGEVVLAGADRIVEGSRERTPVDKGYLAQDQEALLLTDEEGRSEVEIRIGHNLEEITGRAYAGYVEYGTSKMQAQPFIRPAIDEDMPAAYVAMVKKVWALIKQKLGG